MGTIRGFVVSPKIARANAYHVVWPLALKW
jgi:hypothetical protein